MWIAIVGLLAVLVIPVLVLMAFLTLENQNLEDIDWRDED
jgi:hypothetical protein